MGCAGRPWASSQDRAVERIDPNNQDAHRCLQKPLCQWARRNPGRDDKRDTDQYIQTSQPLDLHWRSRVSTDGQHSQHRDEPDDRHHSQVG